MERFFDPDNEESIFNWKSSRSMAAIQWVIIGAGTIDFVVFTCTFLYAQSLAFSSLSHSGKVLTFTVTILFLCIRFLYIPLLAVFLPIDMNPIFPKSIYVSSFLGVSIVYVVLLVFPLLFGLYWAFKYQLWSNAFNDEAQLTAKAEKRILKRIYRRRIANMA
jgi:uncharacterized membrane protein (DUF485 family)